MGDLDTHLKHDFLGPCSPQPKRHLDRFSRLCTDDRRVSLYFTMGRPFPSQNCPFPWGSGPHLIPGSLDPPESSTPTVSQLFKRAHPYFVVSLALGLLHSTHVTRDGFSYQFCCQLTEAVSSDIGLRDIADFCIAIATFVHNPLV